MLIGAAQQPWAAAVAVAVTPVGPGSGAVLAVATNLCHASFAFATPTLPAMMAEQRRMLSFHFSLAGEG
jgi:hypothetical protein